MTITISIPNIVINISNTQNLNLEQMAHTIDELIAEVAESKTLADGVKATISGLRQKVADAIASAATGTSDAELAAIQAKVDSLFTDLAASNDEIAGALTENTPTPAPTDGGVTPPVVGTPAPVDTTPAPVDGTVTDGSSVPPVDGGGTSTDPVPVDGPVAPGTPDVPTAPAAPGTPITNADGSTVI